MDIAICNDNIPELQQLSSFMTRYSQDRPDLPLRFRRFQSLFDLIDRIDMGCSFQVCLLDHRAGQPWMNGLSAEATLRRAAPELSIIGFTGDSHAAFLCPAPGDPLVLEARLVKPASITDLFAVLDRLAKQRLPGSDPALELPVRHGSRLLPFSQLARIHYRAHVVSCHMTSGEVVQSSVLRVPFNQLIQPLLQTGGFSWISAACVVNLALVRGLDKQDSTVRMTDGEVLRVPKSAFPGLRENLRLYQERQEASRRR